MTEKDCRFKQNSNKFTCRIKRFCKPKPNELFNATKNLVMVTMPQTAIPIATYEVGKAVIRKYACK